MLTTFKVTNNFYFIFFKLVNINTEWKIILLFGILANCIATLVFEYYCVNALNFAY